MEKAWTDVWRKSSPTRAQPRQEMHPEEGEWQAVTRQGQKGRGQPQGEPSDRDVEVTAGQTAPKQPKRVQSQVHRRTPSDEPRTSGESLTESARRVCARTPERSFDPISLSNEGTSQIRRFPVAREMQYSRPRPCFAKWTQFHNEHTRKMGEGFELAAGKFGCRMGAAQVLKFRRWYGQEIAGKIRDDDPDRQSKIRFAFQHVPVPVDVSDYDSDKKDPDDPSVRWPDDISSLEYLSGALPFLEDTSDRVRPIDSASQIDMLEMQPNMRQLVNWMCANGRSPKRAQNSEHSGKNVISS